MGIDMWLVKLKDNTKWALDTDKCEYWDAHQKLPRESDCKRCKNICAWQNCKNVSIRKFLPKSNYYFKEGFDSDNEYILINRIILKEMGSDLKFYGEPCLNIVTFNQVVDVDNEWYKTKWNNRTEFIYEDSRVWRLSAVTDMIEYLNCAKKNGFTMWFSF